MVKTKALVMTKDLQHPCKSEVGRTAHLSFQRRGERDNPQSKLTSSLPRLTTTVTPDSPKDHVSTWQAGSYADTGVNTVTFWPPSLPKHAHEMSYTCDYTHADVHKYAHSYHIHMHIQRGKTFNWRSWKQIQTKPCTPRK